MKKSFGDTELGQALGIAAAMLVLFSPFIAVIIFYAVIIFSPKI